MGRYKDRIAVTFDGKVMSLRRKEYAVWCRLVEHIGAAVSTKDMCAALGVDISNLRVLKANIVKELRGTGYGITFQYGTSYTLIKKN